MRNENNFFAVAAFCDIIYLGLVIIINTYCRYLFFVRKEVLVIVSGLEILKNFGLRFYIIMLRILLFSE